MIRDVYHEAVSIGISLAISCVNLWYVNKIEFLDRIKHLGIFTSHIKFRVPLPIQVKH